MTGLWACTLAPLPSAHSARPAQSHVSKVLIFGSQLYLHKPEGSHSRLVCKCWTMPFTVVDRSKVGQREDRLSHCKLCPVCPAAPVTAEKQKNRKDYAFRRQVNEKPRVIPGCPEPVTSGYWGQHNCSMADIRYCKQLHTPALP